MPFKKVFGFGGSFISRFIYFQLVLLTINETVDGGTAISEARELAVVLMCLVSL